MRRNNNSNSYSLLLPFLMAVILLWGSCTPSVRYTRPSSSSSNGYKRPSKKVTTSEKSDSKKNNNTTNVSAVKQNKTSDSASNSIMPVEDNCGLRKAIDSFLGVPYKYGGVDRRGMDCSGLVYRVFKRLGHKDFVRTSSEVMFTMGTPVSRRKMIPGDLVFFKKKGRINHVGIYVGNGEFAHASSTIGVSYTTLDNEYFKKKFVGARRIYKCQ